MLPQLSGLDLCRTIRAESDVPIIMVTAKDSEADKVAGLELGADDYVTKPFSVRELVSRVRAAAASHPRVRPGGVHVDVLSAGRADGFVRHEVVSGELVASSHPRSSSPSRRSLVARVTSLRDGF